MNTPYALGWNGHLVDPRSRDYPMAAAPDALPRRASTQQFWDMRGYAGDQGSIPACTGFAAVHWLNAGPVRNNNVEEGGDSSTPEEDPYEIWGLSQERLWGKRDPNEGSQNTVAMEVLRDMGYISAYYHAEGSSGGANPGRGDLAVRDIQDCLLYKGPVVVGTPWWNSMFFPNRDGFITIDRTKYSTGGHAYLLSGINVTEGWVELKNSWGPDWGTKAPWRKKPIRKGSMARISLDDLRFLFQWSSEATIAVETRRV